MDGSVGDATVPAQLHQLLETCNLLAYKDALLEQGTYLAYLPARQCLLTNFIGLSFPVPVPT